MTSFSRAVSAPVIYTVLAAGALITLAPLAVGLMTSFTSLISEHRSPGDGVQIHNRTVLIQPDLN